MDKIAQRMRLLWLLCILFIYFIIRSYLDGNSELIFFWIIFLMLYIASLILMHIVFRTWQKRASTEVSY